MGCCVCLEWVCFCLGFGFLIWVVVWCWFVREIFCLLFCVCIGLGLVYWCEICLVFYVVWLWAGVMVVSYSVLMTILIVITLLFWIGCL